MPNPCVEGGGRIFISESKMKETKSNWTSVAQTMTEAQSIELGKYGAYWMKCTPRQMLHSLSYYKFASKVIGKNKKVLDVGCNEGIGTYLIGKECGHALGLDFDGPAIEVAQRNFSTPFVTFSAKDFFLYEIESRFDATISFDVIEHIHPSNADRFFQTISNSLTDEGICILGTPSEISQTYASAVSRKGYINIYSPERLEAEMRKVFDCVFCFSAHDELIHTGFAPLAHYLIVVGCKKKD